jgi:hypothetical protein
VRSWTTTLQNERCAPSLGRKDTVAAVSDAMRVK